MSLLWCGAFRVAEVILYMLVFLCAIVKSEFEMDSPLEWNILEERPWNTIVGNVATDSGLDQVYDSETMKLLKYKFLTQPELDRTYFVIEEDTGKIRTTARIDRDLICPQTIDCFLKFDIAVSPVKYFTIIKVILEVVDINDNAPTFPQREMTFDIGESTLPGTSFAIPAPKDLDSSFYGIQNYDLVATSNKFDLRVTNTADGTTDLRLVLKEPLDRELVDHYQIRVIAFDGGSPVKSGSVLIDISVQDANDNDPKFTNVTYEVYVTENIRVGSPVARVKATDPDNGLNGDIMYNLSRHSQREYGNLFGINSASGEVFVKENLDFEQGQIYLISVEAHDRGVGSLPATASLVIRVMDMNDNPPQIKVNTLTTTGEAQVMENAKVGTFVAHISVEDKDKGENGEFACAINNKNFQLQKLYLTSEYKLVTSKVFDRETKKSYTVPFVCKDRGNQPQTSVVNIHVKVMDQNDHAPIFWPRRYSAILEENNPIGAYILKVNATDGDTGPNGKITFKLDTNAGELVHVEPNSGLITAAVIFDYERIKHLEFLVYAVDGGNPPRTATATVDMTILDHDDEPPKFSQESYNFGVYENQDAGADVGRVVAVDADNPPFNSFLYDLDPYHSAVDTFEINHNTGVIYTKKKLDREGQPVYYLTVIADPGDNIMFSSTASVSIYVADRNDNEPVFDFPTVENNTVKISNQSPIGHTLTRLRGHDIDTGTNAKLTYGVVEGNRGNTFTVDPITGAVSVNRDLSTMVLEEFFLKVEVRDNGEVQLVDYEDLVIVVSQKIAFPQHYASLSLEGDNLVIVLAFGLATLFIVIVIVIAIIVIIRKRNREHRNAVVCDKEMQKMLPTTAMMDNSHKPAPQAPNNYVSSKDIEHMKNQINKQLLDHMSTSSNHSSPLPPPHLDPDDPHRIIIREISPVSAHAGNESYGRVWHGSEQNGMNGEQNGMRAEQNGMRSETNGMGAKQNGRTRHR